MSSGRYQAYPEYKESGEEWLGAVPLHWKVIQIKHLSPVKRGASPRPIDAARYFDDNGEYAWTRIADVTASDVYLTTAPQRLSKLGSSLSVKLNPGELFLSIAGSVGKPCITGIKACIHDGFVYFPELKIPNKFLFYVFAGEQAYKGLGKFGTQLNLNTDTVGGIKIGCGNSDEIEQIVRFLDHETAKIDRLIEKQQALISLLKEKRQAVISHAVTKGLNPHAPLKDSGIEWLGQIPEHWKILRVKTVSTFLTSGPRGWSERVGEEGSLFIQSGDLNDRLGIEYATAKRVIVGNDAETDRTRLIEGDVVVCITGAKTGNVAVAESVPEAAFINQHLCLVRPDSNIRPSFLGSFLKGQIGQTYFELSQYGLKQGLSLEDVKEAPVVLPPFDEQAAIVEHLKIQTFKFDAIMQEAFAAVTLLQERRTALISAAVTGKIDVRHWQPPVGVSKVETTTAATG